MPDRIKEPLDYLRWQMEHSPHVPAHIKAAMGDPDELCERFRLDIAEGRRVWSDDHYDWVHPSWLNEQPG